MRILLLLLLSTLAPILATQSKLLKYAGLRMPPPETTQAPISVATEPSVTNAPEQGASVRKFVDSVENLVVAVPESGKEYMEEDPDSWLRIKLQKEAERKRQLKLAKDAQDEDALKNSTKREPVTLPTKLSSQKRPVSLWEEMDTSKIWDLLQMERANDDDASPPPSSVPLEDNVAGGNATLKILTDSVESMPSRATILLFGDSLGAAAQILAANTQDALIISVVASEEEVKRQHKSIQRGKVLFVVNSLDASLAKALASSVLSVQLVVVMDPTPVFRALVPSEVETVFGHLASLTPLLLVRFSPVTVLTKYQNDASVFFRAAASRVGLDDQASSSTAAGNGFTFFETQSYTRSLELSSFAKLHFSKTASELKSLPFHVALIGGKDAKPLECDIVGVPLSILNTLSLSQSSKRYLLTKFIAGNIGGGKRLFEAVSVDASDIWIEGFGGLAYDTCVSNALKSPSVAPLSAPQVSLEVEPDVVDNVKEHEDSGESPQGLEGGGRKILSLTDEQQSQLDEEESRKEAKKQDVPSYFFEAIKDILPDVNLPADFSGIFHEEPELSLKVGQLYPKSTLLSYCANTNDANFLASATGLMGIENIVVGNPRHFAGADAHDPIERIIMDLKGGADLFDFQFMSGDFFATLLHHSQAEFEKMLGQSFTLARTTIIAAPQVRLLNTGLAMFGAAGKEATLLSDTCMSAKRVKMDEKLSSSEEEAQARLLLGWIACASDAANVETRARVLVSRQGTVLIEVRLVSMSRPIGGLWQYPRGEKTDARNYFLQYARDASDEERLFVALKDGTKSLQWKSPLRGRGAHEFMPLEKGRGVSLYAILAIRPLDAVRRKLAQWYLRDADFIVSPQRNLGPGPASAQPWSTYLYHKTLFYVWPFAYDSDGERVSSSVLEDWKAEPHDDSKSADAVQLELDMAAGMGLAADIAAMQDMWLESPFSFLEHNTNSGFAATSIARVFPKSSVLIVTDTEEKRRNIERLFRRNKASNGLVVLQKSIDEYASSMVKSPEHFNFQYFSGFYNAWRRDPEDFGGAFKPQALGDLLACSQVSYFLLPHPRILSLALAVFHGPDASVRIAAAPPPGSSRRHVDHFASAAAGSTDIDDSIFELYHVENHPKKSPLKDWDFELIDRRFEGNAVQKMTMQRVPVPRAKVGVSMGDLKRTPSGRWTLIRVVPTKMERVVQHHFRAEIDGHKRRYQLSQWTADTSSAPSSQDEESAPALGEIASAWTSGKVAGVGKTWLKRMGDGGQLVSNSLIPYTHFGVSLITLLRIGMSETTKERLYGQFLQIPMYQDMATWNIQWASGRLAYVDVDTMDAHLEESLAHAYQVILALMNYERTVADFGKCEKGLRLPFNIPFVGTCVKSSNDRRRDDQIRRDMGCTDELPVPCRDGECKPTFVHCLRDLFEKKMLGEEIPENDFIVAKKGHLGKDDKAEADAVKRRRRRRPRHDKIVRILPDLLK